MKKEHLKNRKKIIRECPDMPSKKMEILFTILYNSRLYCAFRFLDEEEGEIYYSRFTLEDQEMQLKKIDTQKDQELLTIMNCILEEGNYQTGQHFVWLHDKHELILQGSILDNQEMAFWEHLISWYISKTGLRKIIRVITATLILILLFILAAAAVWANAMEWERLLQYRHFCVNGLRISATTVRITMLVGYICVCMFLSAILKKIAVKWRFGSAFIGIAILSLIYNLLIFEHMEKWEAEYVENMDYNYSIVKRRAQPYQDVYFELQGEQIIIPLRLEEPGFPKSMQFKAWFQWDACLDGSKIYTSNINEEKTAAIITIPELLTEYQYGLVTVVASDDPYFGSQYPLGEKPQTWYQKFLGTSLDFNRINRDFNFEYALDNGEINADSKAVELWRMLLKVDTVWVLNYLYKLWWVVLILFFIYHVSSEFNNDKINGEVWILQIGVNDEDD